MKDEISFMRDASTLLVPKFAMKYKDNLLRTLVALCAAMHETRRGNSFSLSAAKAARAIGVQCREPAMEAWAYLRQLENDGIIAKTYRGGCGKASEYRYIGKSEQEIQHNPSDLFADGGNLVSCPLCAQSPTETHPVGVRVCPPGIAYEEGALLVGRDGISVDLTQRPRGPGVEIGIEFRCESNHSFRLEFTFLKGLTSVSLVSDGIDNSNWNTIWRD